MVTSFSSSVTVGSNALASPMIQQTTVYAVQGDQVSLLNGSSFSRLSRQSPIILRRYWQEYEQPFSRKDVHRRWACSQENARGLFVFWMVHRGRQQVALDRSTGRRITVAFGIVRPGDTFSPGSAMVWVPNELSGTVSVISSPPRITSFSSSPSTIDLGFPPNDLVTYQEKTGSDISSVGCPRVASSASKLMVKYAPNVSRTFILAVNLTDWFGFLRTLRQDSSSKVHSRCGTSFSPSTLPNIDPGIPLRGTTACNRLAPYSFSSSFFRWQHFEFPCECIAFVLTSGCFCRHRRKLQLDRGHDTSSSTVVVVASPPALRSRSIPATLQMQTSLSCFKETITGGVRTVRQDWSFADGTTSLGPNARLARRTRQDAGWTSPPPTRSA